MTDTNKSKEQKLASDLTALDEMSIGDLRIAWRRLYRSEAPPRLSRDLMVRAVAFKIQERAYGGLKGPVKRKLKAVMEAYAKGEAKIPSRSQKLQPGMRLLREWHGRRYDVQVLDNGFEFDGRSYASLTAIAQEITGVHWSGPRFFGLNKAAQINSQQGDACHD